jgi:hypothetical protein
MYTWRTAELANGTGLYANNIQIVHKDTEDMDLLCSLIDHD